MVSRYHIRPIAPIEDNTVRFPAGVLTLGLEMRELNPAIVNDFYDGMPEEGSVQAIMGRQGTPDDGGASIHVFGTDDGLEYLRFDCFDKGPHYHYVHPREEFQDVCEMDPVALGDSFAWAVDRLRSRLPAMLGEAGGSDLVPGLDADKVEDALRDLVELYATISREGDR